MDKLVLIDGYSLLNRAFYATPLFSTKTGQPTNAIFGFVKLLFKINSDLAPKYIIVAFDLKAPTFRHKRYEAYKATRNPMPPELLAQVEPLKALLSAMKIATCELEGYEADDIIGTLSNSFDGVHSIVYTGDRDSYQLVDERTDVYFTKRGVSELLKLSLDNFQDEVGLKPSQIIDLKALMGDKSDNIPGVDGIGEKTAKELLIKYGSLDGVYENIDEISGALNRKLTAGKEQAYLSYELAAIDRNCPLQVKLQDCVMPQTYSMEVKRIFTAFEFRSLKELNIFEKDSEVKSSTEILYPEIEKITNRERLSGLFEASGEYFLDVSDNRVQIYTGGKLYELTYGDDLLCEISTSAFCDCLKKICEKPENRIIVYDYKKFLHYCSSLGIKPVCDFDDLSVIKYIVDYFDNNNTLADLCKYNGYDPDYLAFVLCGIYKKYLKDLAEDGQYLYDEIEKPLIEVLFEMEKEGVKVDFDRLDEFGKKYSAEINRLSAEIFEKCGTTFNLNSPTQLGEVLFEKLGLKAGKKSKNGKYSTSAEVLEKLADENEVVRSVLDYRGYQKLYSTYIEGFRPLIDRKTCIVHTTYNQTVTTTGRLSSVNPNLQNIPIRENEGRELRKMFVPQEGNVFIDADYSQIELRLLAHFSGCKQLIDAYLNDEDIHAVTASQVFGVPQSEVTSNMRREAKAVNFGIIYGISEFGLSQNLNIPVKTAKEYIETYFEKYSAVKEYMQSNVNFAKENGYVATLIGRKRYIRELNSSNYNIRQFGERAAMNMPLQGSSADIIKIAMINVFRALKQKNMKTRLILQVHDELVLDSPISEVDEASAILKYEMENAVKLNVPLKVDVHCGKNWYEAK